MIHALMAFMLAIDLSVVVEEAVNGDPVRMAGGERYDTDRFLPKARGGQRVVSPKFGGSTGGV